MCNYVCNPNTVNFYWAGFGHSTIDLLLLLGVEWGRRLETQADMCCVCAVSVCHYFVSSKYIYIYIDVVAVVVVVCVGCRLVWSSRLSSLSVCPTVSVSVCLCLSVSNSPRRRCPHRRHRRPCAGRVGRPCPASASPSASRPYTASCTRSFRVRSASCPSRPWPRTWP